MKVAIIFEDVGGYYISDANNDFLDARGHNFRSKAAALRAACSGDYTHATGSGTPWQGIRRIPDKYREEQYRWT